MNSSPKDKLSHLCWVVKSRAENQVCAIKLFRLLTTYGDAIKQGEYELFAQSLVGITFSLWRAAFLADRVGTKEAGLKSAIEFLNTVIEDNAITYAQDKLQKEWTFNYYTHNVRYTLLFWHKKWPQLVPEWQYAARNGKQRWRYAQKLLMATVDQFDETLRSRP
jgi:hypothetical protein